jgi:tetratricopeptide (TPR) repeat protein
MASYRQLDAVGATEIIRTFIRRLGEAVLLCSVALCAVLFCTHAWSQSAPQNLRAVPLAELFQQQRWQEIANLHPELGISADTDFEYGIALARLQRWRDAEGAFESGLHLQPRDPRFMVELAGVAFKQGRYSDAAVWMQQALKISPDNYDFDFLGTVYYLEGNLEAALKYWNRIGKPQIGEVTSDPIPRLNPVLLDRAFVFSPASTLTLSDLRTTEARVRELGVFSTDRFELEAQPDDGFNVAFRATERNGCGANRWQCLSVLFAQTPAQTVNFNYFNIARHALNFTSSFRWDGEKRRVVSRLEFPLANNPKWELQASVDLRNENWALRNSFNGPAPLLGALNLKREVAAARFTDVMSGNWQWFATTELSNRDYHNVLPGSVLPPQLLTSGFQLKQSFGMEGTLFLWPERRLNIDGDAVASFARLWSARESYSQLQGSVRLHWFPQHTGERYEIRHQIRVGKTLGRPPFDELFILGVLGDTDLYMRAHIATRDGKKGSAPLGRDYFLSNFEALRDVSPISIAHIKVGPFVDTGKVADPLSQLGSGKWLWDAGVEARLQAFGVSVTLSYGRDLRGGRNALVATSP